MAKVQKSSFKAIKFPKGKKPKTYPVFKPYGIPKANFGGSMEDLGMGVLQTMGPGEMAALTGHSLADLTGYQEKTKGGQGFNKGAEFGSKMIGGVAPMVGGAFGGPLGGLGVKAGQSMVNMVQPNFQQKLQGPQNPYMADVQYRKFGGKFEDGGPLDIPSPRKKIINAEKNELIVDPKHPNNIVRNLSNLPPHPEDESMIDPRGNVAAQEGHFVIPKNKAKEYNEAANRLDTVKTTSMMIGIHRKNQKMKEQEAMVANDNLQKMLKKGGFYKNGGAVQYGVMGNNAVIPNIEPTPDNSKNFTDYSQYGLTNPQDTSKSFYDTNIFNTPQHISPQGVSRIKGNVLNQFPQDSISTNGLPFKEFGGEVGTYAQGGTVDKDGDTVKMEKGEFAKEHKNLLKILRTGTKAQREKEAVKQEAEMAEKMKHGGKIKHFLNNPVPQQFERPDVQMGYGGSIGAKRYGTGGFPDFTQPETQLNFRYGQPMIENVNQKTTGAENFPFQQKNASVFQNPDQSSFMQPGLERTDWNEMHYPGQGQFGVPNTSGASARVPVPRDFVPNREEPKPFDYNNALQKGAEYSPTAFNFAMATQKPYQYDYNKYSINSKIPYRDVNFDPIQRGIEQQGRIGAQNLKEGSGGSGRNYQSNELQNIANTQGQVATGLMNAQQFNNQNRLGVDQTNLGIEERNKQLALQIDSMNRMNKAKTTEYLGKGFEQASGYAQRDMYQNDQNKNQQQLLGGMSALYPWLQQYFKANGVPG